MKNCILINIYIVFTAIAMTFASYYIITLYRDWIYTLPYWNKLK